MSNQKTPKIVTQVLLRNENKLAFQMPTTKIEAFLKEFPWVTNFVNKFEILQVYVSRISSLVMAHDLANLKIPAVNQWHPETYESNEWMETISPEINHREHVFFLDQYGSMVKKENIHVQIMPAIPARPKTWWFGSDIPAVPEHKIEKKTIVFGQVSGPENICDKVVKLMDVADSIRFVLSYWNQSNAVIIYKVPKDVTLPLWIQKQIDDEQAGFKQECEAIDAEAVTA